MRQALTPHRIFLLIGATAVLAFAWSFVARTNTVVDDFYMVPIWVFGLAFYVYWGFSLKHFRTLHIALLPLALLAIVEIAWGSIALSSRTFVRWRTSGWPPK